MTTNYRTVVVKVGTNVITGGDGLLNTQKIRGIAAQITELSSRGTRVILVTSGAMGAGQALLRPSSKLGRVTQRQVLAAVGQIHLMRAYEEAFEAQGMMIAQVLATKEDFEDRHHYLNMRTCLDALLTEKIIPVVNENDTVAIDALMFSDNDELAGLIATMMRSDALVLLTNVDGVYDGDPDDSASKVIKEILQGSDAWAECIHPKKSSFGRGGMMTKCQTAGKLSRLGITTHIVNGGRPHVLLEVCGGTAVGTTFPAAVCRIAGRKRWVAGGVSRAKGVVVINEGCLQAITSAQRIASVLPIGIVKIEGDFEKGDIIRIKDEAGRDIGLGSASYGIEHARTVMGKKGEKPLIHYDHLFLPNSH